jgi:O-antigen/teichoic acid export membrane protein
LAALSNLKAHNPFPPGSVAIGLGLVVNGVATYGSLVVVRRVLGPDSYASFAVLWGLVFILAPGLFQPLEQELSRATAERAVRGLGSAPVLRRAAAIGAIGLALFGSLVLVSWPVGLDGVLDQDLALLAALLFALAGFVPAELVRGILSGRHRFGRYGAYMATEGLGRLVIVATFTGLGVRTVGWFGLSLGGAFLLAAAVGVGTRRPFAEPGPEAGWAELTPALGLLLTTSVAEAALLNVGPVAVRVLSNETAAAGMFLNGLIVSRVPLFLFAAIKAALLPNLARLAEAGDVAGFRRLLGRLLGALGMILVASVAGAAALGPWVVKLLFDDTLARRDLALLALSSEGSMVVVTLSLGLVALGRARSAALGWAVGAACFVVAVVGVETAPFLRVELALVVAVGTAAVTMAIALGRTSVVRSAHA